MAFHCLREYLYLGALVRTRSLCDQSNRKKSTHKEVITSRWMIHLVAQVSGDVEQYVLRHIRKELLVRHLEKPGVQRAHTC